MTHEINHVWVGFDNYFDNCDEWVTLAKLFKNEESAKKWKNSMKSTQSEWRTIEKRVVED